MRKWIVGTIAVIALLAISGGLVFASPVLVEQRTKTTGATTVTWDSSFADFDYILDDTISMTVDWAVDAGAATYAGFELKSYTPKFKEDPALGTAPVVAYPGTNGDNSVDVSFRFTELHLCKDRNVEVGVAHFTLKLNVDTDGDGIWDSVAGYEVNVHVEDPQ